MQAYEVEFAPAQLSPLRITDGVRAHAAPAPHVPVGDVTTPGKGVRIPLTARLAAVLDPASPLISRAKAYRDPRTGTIVLGVEQAEDAGDTRALVLLSASIGFPDGIAISRQKGLGVLARGTVGHAQQLLLIWPDGSTLTVEDRLREERHALRRTGDTFERVTAS